MILHILDNIIIQKDTCPNAKKFKNGWKATWLELKHFNHVAFQPFKFDNNCCNIHWVVCFLYNGPINTLFIFTLCSYQDNSIDAYNKISMYTNPN